MTAPVALFLVLLLGSSTYAAGRLHARVGYRFGYRFGYRQGYFDGDRACWNRRRREVQAAIGDGSAGPGRLPGGSGRRPEPESPAVARLTRGHEPEAVYSAIRARTEVFSIVVGTTYASASVLGRHANTD
jgi:hypothetical protein